MLDTATLYISDSSLLGEKFFSQFEEITAIEPQGEGEQTSELLITTHYGKIRLSFLAEEELPEHIQEMEEYVKESFNGEDPQLDYILGRLEAVQLAMELELAPEGQQEEEMIHFLYALNDRFNGLLFIFDSLVDYDGEPLVGPLTEEFEDEIEEPENLN